MSQRLLFVCAGNTCRSPMAAALAREWGVEAESAGVDAQAGHRAAPNALRALHEARQIRLDDHTPRAVTDVELAAFDRVVAMDPSVAHRLRTDHGIGEERLVTWAVFDPYGGPLSDYRLCLEHIATALDDLLS